MATFIVSASLDPILDPLERTPVTWTATSGHKRLGQSLVWTSANAPMTTTDQKVGGSNPSGRASHLCWSAACWADKTGISADAFLAEGVPAAVLRRASFRGVPSGRRSTGSRRTTKTRPASTSSRVSADYVRAAIPDESYADIKDLQERSGASAAVVRRVINEEVDAGRLTDQGSDPDHTGPGRAATIYQPA